MRAIFKKLFPIFAIVLFVFNFLLLQESFAKPKSLKVAPKKITVSVDQVPDNLVSLVVPLTFDTSIVNISAAGSNAGGSLVVFSQGGVGIIKTNGNLPSMFNLTVTFKGLLRGKSSISAGEVVDKLGGMAIQDAVAITKTKKIKVK